MEIIYKAVDDKLFATEADCLQHEKEVASNVIMYTRDGRRTESTCMAFVVWLKDEAANLAFHAMAEVQNDPDVGSIVKGEDYGLFLWDECTEEYRYVSEEEVFALMAITEAIRERGK